MRYKSKKKNFKRWVLERFLEDLLFPGLRDKCYENHALKFLFFYPNLWSGS